MRRTGLLGLLVISTLTAAIPAKAATEIPTLPAATAALESGDLAADDNAEDAVSTEVVSETETEPQAQEAEADAEVQTQNDDGTDLSSDPAADPSLTDASEQEDGSELIGNTDLEESAGAVEGAESEDSSALSEDTSISEAPTIDEIDETISADPGFDSGDEVS